MTSIRRAVVAFVLAFAIAAFFALISQAKPDYTKKEGKNCLTCHVKAGSKELNDVGKCYEKKKSLKDCELPAPKK